MYNKKINLRLYAYQNGSFVQKAIIEYFREISWENNLYEAGQFSISINYNIPNSQLFQRGLFVQFGDDPYAFGEITKIQDSIGEDGKSSQIRIITGFDIRYILKRRVIKNMNSNGLWVMTAKGELCLRNLIKDQCGSGAETKRQLPIINNIPDSANAIGKEFSVSEQFSNLYEVCKTIATQSEIGWRMKFYSGNLTLECYSGEDKSQTVKFDTDYDSLANGQFIDSSESFSNAIYVGGKGQNEGRDIYEGESAIGGSSPSGLDRFESWDNQSQMTIESEYETEALSMLTQYGQTIQMQGNGLAKCPYIYKEEYNVGDIITVAFSGKSAAVQILSVTEHWAFGNYEIQFEFGKPQPNLNDQLQLILRKIQEASNKTDSTESVKWYTIPTDTAMPKADVTYNTIGFTGTCASGGSTFKLYLDNEKTGAKTYHIYFKQLGGGNLTLTTGKTGATDLVLNSGTYVAIIYVDENGNVSSQSAGAVSEVSVGNLRPVTSNAVAIADNYDYQYYKAGEQTCYEIDIPFTADNGSPNGTILINERNGSSYLFVFNTIIVSSDVSTRNYVGKVTVLRGNVRERLLSELRWDIDTNNNVIKFYLRKGSSIANSRFLFKVLQVYPRNTNITFSAYVSSVNWDNAQYSSPFTVVVGTAGTITTGVNGVPFSGYITSASTKMHFLIPMFLNGEEIITVNEMKVVARSVTGQYIEATFNVGFDALSSPYTLTITKFPKIGIFIGIEKTSAFVYNGTSTNVLNNSPVVVTPKMNITIS